MSAFSTLNITREKAIQFLISKVASADNETLVNMLDKALQDRLYNVRIVPDWDNKENDDNVL